MLSLRPTAWLKKLLSPTRSPAVKPSRTRRRLAIDLLEDRWMPAAPVGVVIVEPQPPAGPSGGGVILTLNGQNFEATSTVDFVDSSNVSTPGTNVELSGGSLLVTQPALAAGTYNVIVSNGSESSTASGTTEFTVTDGPAVSVPIITGVSPNSGAVGQPIIISGSYFTQTSTVTFIDQSNSTPYPVSSGVVIDQAGTTVTLDQPSLPIGVYDIRITNDIGQSAVTPDDVYTVLLGPIGVVITSPTPAQGPVAGGVTLTLAGQNFEPTSTVEFVSSTNVATPAASVSYDSTTLLLTVVQPAGLAVGTYQVIVSNGAAHAQPSTQTAFEVVAQVAPTVTSVSPASPAYGTPGTTVTVNGTALNSTTGSTTVAFVSSTNVSTAGTDVVVSPDGTSLTVTQPDLTPGTYSIIVTNNAGSSQNTPDDDYIAVAPAIVATTQFTNNGVVVSTVTTLDVKSTADFTATGSLFVQTSGGVATMTYTGKTNTSFTGITVVANDPFGVGANDTTGTLMSGYPAVFQATNKTYDITFTTNTNITSGANSTIYASMFWSSVPADATAAPVFYYLNSPNANGTGGTYTKVDTLTVGSTLPSYTILVGTGNTITIPVPYIPTNSARFVIGFGVATPVTVVENSSQQIGLALPNPISDDGYYDYVEFTFDGSAADSVVPNGGRNLPTFNINTSQVDQFGFPITLTGLNNVNGVGVLQSVGVTLSPNVARDAIFTQYESLYPSTSAYGQLVIPSTDPTQPYRILNPGKEQISTSNALGYVFDDAIDKLFKSGSTNLTLVSSANGFTYTSTRTTHAVTDPTTQVTTTYQVLAFTSPSDPGNTYYVYQPFFSGNAPAGGNAPLYANAPVAPYWLTSATETPGQMIFGNDGVFGDAGLQPGLSPAQVQIVADLENQLVAALNRGIANLYNTTAQWQDPSNFYPAGEVSNLYAKFLHDQYINGTQIFIDGKAYAIAYDDQGGQNPTIVVVNGDEIAVTLGNWTAGQTNPDPNVDFVNDLYMDLLGRAPEQGGLDYWVGLLNQGVPRANVAAAIDNSDEAIARYINGLYQDLLGRAADAGGFAAYFGAIKAGATDDQVRSIFYSSAEYFAKSGSTNDGFLNQMFLDQLGRPVDSVGLAAYTGALNQGTSRFQVALSVLASLEADRDQVNDYYLAFLKRAADAGAAGWVQILQAGQRESIVRVDILSSQEYFNL